MRSVGLEGLTVDVADAVQEQLMEKVWRPVAGLHSYCRGVHPEMLAGAAMWTCLPFQTGAGSLEDPLLGVVVRPEADRLVNGVRGRVGEVGVQRDMLRPAN